MILCPEENVVTLAKQLFISADDKSGICDTTNDYRAAEYLVSRQHNNIVPQNNSMELIRELLEDSGVSALIPHLDELYNITCLRYLDHYRNFVANNFRTSLKNPPVVRKAWTTYRNFAIKAIRIGAFIERINLALLSTNEDKLFKHGKLEVRITESKRSNTKVVMVSKPVPNQLYCERVVVTSIPLNSDEILSDSDVLEIANAFGSEIAKYQ